MFDSFFKPAFMVTLALSLAGGLLFVIAQLAAIIAGQGEWLLTLNQTLKIPVIVASSICAIFGYLLTYGPQPEGTASDETR